MKKRIATLLLTLLTLCIMAGCSGGGTPPVLTLDGHELTIGTSSPGTLPATEYEMKIKSQMPIGNIPGNSWLSEFMTAKKGDETYAYFYIYNPTSDAKSFLSATLYKVSFTMNSEENSYWAKNNILVNGINFFGMDSAAVKEAMKDYKLARETDTGTLRYEDGDYKYFISFQEDTGLVDEVTAELAIPKSYDETK